MTDYKIENTDINDEENFRAWERLVMDYEPVRRNLYEVYCKSLENGCKKATKPEPEPEPKKTFSPTLTINTSFLNHQLQELESDGDNFSSDEEVEDINTTEEQEIINRIPPYPEPITEDAFTQEEVNDFTKKHNEEYISYAHHDFYFKIPKMNINLPLYHYKTTNKQVSFRFSSAEFSQDLVITKGHKYWTNIINGVIPDDNFQFNKKQKDIFLAAYPYDKQRLPPMFISRLKD